MTCVPTLIATLKGRGAQFSVVGHQLEITAPDGVIDDDVRASIKKHKEAIIDLILRESSVTTPPFPTSNVQNRMSLNAKTSRHGDHVRSMHRFRGEIDKASMSAAVQVMIQRNPTLTIRFMESKGKILQQLTPIGMFHVDSIELLDGEDSSDAARRYVERPFDMVHDPMFRVGMTDADESETRHLVSVVHHALADGYANALITRTLSELYNQIESGERPEIHDPSKALDGYRDFCIQTSSREDEEESEDEVGIGRTLVSAFPLCDEQENSQEKIDFQMRNISIPSDLRTKLEAFGRKHTINLMTVSITAAQILIKKTHPEETGVIGCPISSRMSESSLDLISNMTVELPFVQDFQDSESLLAVMKRVQRDLLGRLNVTPEPLESLIERGHLPARGRRRLRLPFSVGVYEFKSGLDLTGVKTTRDFDSHENPFIGMALRILHDEDKMEVEYEYDRSMVGDRRASELADAYVTIIRAMCEEPTKSFDQISIESTLRDGMRLHTTNDAKTPEQGSTKNESPTMLEVILASHWTKILKISQIGRRDRFFELGGSSLQLIRLIDSVGDTIGRQITLSDFIGDPTLMELAELLTSESSSLMIPPTMEIAPDARGNKVFCIPGQGGISAFTFSAIAENMKDKARLIGLQIPGLNPDSEQVYSMDGIIEQMVDVIEECRDPEDPVMIIGHSAGGIIGMEIVKVFQERGVHCLPPILIGTAAPVQDAKKGFKERIQSRYRRHKMLKSAQKNNKALNLMESGSTHGRVEARLKEAVDRMSIMISKFSPTGRYCSDIHLINDSGTRFCTSDENTTRWSRLTDGEVTEDFIDCDHLDLISMGERTIQKSIEESILFPIKS